MNDTIICKCFMNDITICECCWRPIKNGEIYEIDGTYMCKKCFEYSGGFDEVENEIKSQSQRSNKRSSTRNG